MPAPIAVTCNGADQVGVGIAALMNTSASLATLPILILFFLLRRQFMEGITAYGTGLEK